MKKLLLIIAVLILSLLLLAGCTSYPTNGERENLVTDMNSYDLLEEFTSNYPDRTVGDSTSVDKETGLNNCDRAGIWISEQFMKMGYTAKDNGLVPFTYTNSLRNDRVEKAYNIIFVKDNPNTQEQVVIAAHYDNVANLAVEGNILGGEGAYNNAVGVIALLQTARQLKDIDLPYDVVFAAFSAEEIDMAGSSNYVSSLSKEQIESTLLMINYSSITGGDYVYMYADEVPREHYNLFLDNAKAKNYNITPTPKNLRNIMNAQLKGTDLMYYNMAMAGDNLQFHLKGINTLTYLSCNFNDKSTQSLVELKGYDNVLYTKDDTLINMMMRMGGEVNGKARINSDIDTVVMNTVNTMQNADFASVMKSSKANAMDYSVLANYNTMRIIGYCVLGVGIAVLVVLYFVLKSNLKPHSVIIETAVGRVDMSRGVIIPDATDTSATQNVPKIDPFEEEFGSSQSNKNSDKNDKASDNKKIVEVDEKDIFEDF